MKNFIYALLACAIITITSCEPPIKGAGAPITETKSVANFNAVITDLPGNLHITCKDDTALTCSISAQPNIMPLIECLVEKDELLIRFKRTSRIESSEDININITMPTLKGVKSLGSGNTTIDGMLITENLLCSLMGSGEMTVQGATIRKCRADITGSGKISLNNSTCIYAEYAIKGSGTIEAGASAVDSVKAIVAGSGDIHCLAVKNIDAEINGSGNIGYKGKPNVSRNKIGGNGKIEAE
jgi:Putative auto-transporter adhesin, head GIN domain